MVLILSRAACVSVPSVLVRLVLIIGGRVPSRRECEIASTELVPVAGGIEVSKIDGRTILRIQAVIDHDELRLREAGHETIEPAFEQECLAVLLVRLAIGFEQNTLALRLIDKLGSRRGSLGPIFQCKLSGGFHR